jgi:NitT/TauT family transport system permease protein
MRCLLSNPWSLVGLLAIALLWQVVAGIVGSVLVPGPAAIAAAGFQNFTELAEAIGATLRRATIAFLTAALVMAPFGIICARIRLIGRYVDPLLEFWTAVPPPAVIPLVMLFAGIGDAAKIAVTIYACGPLVLVNTMEGARHTPMMYERVACSLRFSRFRTMVSVTLPATTPAIIVGMRLAIATSFLVSITSEMLLATDGMGTYLQSMQENYQIAASLSGIAAVSIVGLAINQVVRLIERRLLFWYYR